MRRLLSMFVCSGLLLGCESKHLVYVNENSMGLDVAVSTEGSGRLAFGYDRQVFAVVPKKGDGQDAISLTAVSCIYAKGIDEISFNHFVASGETAKDVAKDAKGLVAIRQAIYGGGEKCEP